jgi:hypothetical protein
MVQDLALLISLRGSASLAAGVFGGAGHLHIVLKPVIRETECASRVESGGLDYILEQVVWLTFGVLIETMCTIGDSG